MKKMTFEEWYEAQGLDVWDMEEQADWECCDKCEGEGYVLNHENSNGSYSVCSICDGAGDIEYSNPLRDEYNKQSKQDTSRLYPQPDTNDYSNLFKDIE